MFLFGKLVIEILNEYFAVLTALINVSLRGSPVYSKVKHGIISVVSMFLRSSGPTQCMKPGCLQSQVRLLRVLFSQALKNPEDGDFTTSLGRLFHCLIILIMKLQEGVYCVFFKSWIQSLFWVSHFLLLGKIQITYKTV